jgi:hypothetical protein
MGVFECCWVVSRVGFMFISEVIMKDDENRSRSGCSDRGGVLPSSVTVGTTVCPFPFERLLS